MVTKKSTAIKYQDKKFDEGSGWNQFFRNERFEQRFLDEDGLMYCETLLNARCSVGEAIAILRGPWTWWDHGRSIGFRLNGDRSSDQYLKPAKWFWTKIGMRIFPPVAIPGASGLRLPLTLSNHFVGTASLDVCPKPGAPDWVLIRGRFHGVENHVPLVPLWMATRRHMRAEAGNFLFPYPKGTGWVGPYRRLEECQQKAIHRDDSSDRECECALV